MTAIDTLHEEKQRDGSVKYFIRRRKFLGKISEFDTKEEERFEKKHLKAYLLGKESFISGYKSNSKDARVPVWTKVKQGILLLPITEEERNKIKEKVERLKHDILTSRNNS